MDCWDTLRLISENLPNVDVAARSLQSSLQARGGRYEKMRAYPDPQNQLLIVAVRTARQVREIDAEFAFHGYLGYAVTPEITEWPHPLHRPPLKLMVDSPSNNRRNRFLYEQAQLLIYTAAGLKALNAGLPVPYPLCRRPSVESKLSAAARAYLAHNIFSGGWNEHQHFTLSVEDPQLHWHYVNGLALPITGENGVTEEDLKLGARRMWDNFRTTFVDTGAVTLISQREIFGGSVIQCEVRFESEEAMRTVLAPAYVKVVSLPNDGNPGVDF